jgi:UDP-N-acetylmuramoylalanine--D-glutamate ligase
MYKIKDKKVAVIGLSKRTGVATAKSLVDHGAEVVVSDIKPSNQLLEEQELLNGYEVDYDLNGHSDKVTSCDLIVVSPGVPLDIPVFNIIRQKKIPVISEIELAYSFNKAKIIAITGTNGKTTTTSLTSKILQGAEIGKVRVAGNIGTPFIRVVDELGRDDWVVLEVSSFQLETIKYFKPYISMFLNFSPDHLDRHKSEEEYWKAKKKIFLNQENNDIAIINNDDQRVLEAAQDCEANKYCVSLEEGVKNGIFMKQDSLVTKRAGLEEKVIDLDNIPMLGPHNIQNAAFAVMASRLIGIDKKTIRREISKFTPGKHRLEVVGKAKDGILIVDDSKATNPDSAVKALKSINSPITLIAGGQDRKADFSIFGETINDQVKTLVLLGETRHKLKNAVLKAGFDNIYIVDNMAEAVKISLSKIKSGDCLMLSPGCPSWDMYASYKKRGRDFKDKIKSQSNFLD